MRSHHEAGEAIAVVVFLFLIGQVNAFIASAVAHDAHRIDAVDRQARSDRIEGELGKNQSA